MYSNRFFKGQEEIELPKKQLEINYEKSLIPELYKNLIGRNSVKINQVYADAITEAKSGNIPRKRGKLKEQVIALTAVSQ